MSRRTKIFAAVVVLLSVLSFMTGYGHYRRVHEIRAQWRGQEQALEYMEVLPTPPMVFRLAALGAMFSLIGTFVSVSVDVIGLWRRSRR